MRLRGPNKPADRALLGVTRAAKTAAIMALGSDAAPAQVAVPPCWVYFFRSGDAIKIGYARDPYTRLMNLRTAAPHEVESLGVMPGGPDLETDVHERFDHLRIRGEWFRAEDDLLAFIKAHRFDPEA